MNVKTEYESLMINADKIADQLYLLSIGSPRTNIGKVILDMKEMLAKAENLEHEIHLHPEMKAEVFKDLFGEVA